MPQGDLNALDYLFGTAPQPALGPQPFGPPKVAPGDASPEEIARAVWQHAGYGQQQQQLPPRALDDALDLYNKAGLQNPNKQPIEDRLAADPSNLPPFPKPQAAPQQAATPPPDTNPNAKGAQGKTELMFIQNGRRAPEIISYTNGKISNRYQQSQLYPTEIDPKVMELLEAHRSSGPYDPFIDAYRMAVTENKARAQFAAERREAMYGSGPQGQAGAGSQLAQALQGQAAQRPTLDWYLSQVPQQYDITQGKNVYDFGQLNAALAAFNRQEQTRLMEQADLMLNTREREKNDLLRQQVNEKYDPRFLRTKHATEIMRQNPGATPAQVMSEVDRLGEILQGLENSNPLALVGTSGQPGPSGQQGAVPGIDDKRPNSISVERQRRAVLGPEIYDLLNSKPNPKEAGAFFEKAMTDLYRHAKRTPGYIERAGPEVLETIRRNFGEQALEDFMNPGFFTNATEGAGSILSGRHNTLSQARAAMRHYMGRKMPGLFGGLVSPHSGIAPIPGSPAAQPDR